MIPVYLHGTRHVLPKTADEGTRAPGGSGTEAARWAVASLTDLGPLRPPLTPDDGGNAHRFSDRIEAAVGTLSREVHADWWQARRGRQRGGPERREQTASTGGRTHRPGDGPGRSIAAIEESHKLARLGTARQPPRAPRGEAMSDINPRADADAGGGDGGNGGGSTNRGSAPGVLEGEVVTKLSSRSVAETASLFTNMLVDKGLKIFNVIDQSDEARLVGLQAARDHTGDVR